MIGYIRGTVEEIAEDMLLLDHNGMGFRIFMAAGHLAAGVRTGDAVKLYTYLHVKEDAMQLYGFFFQRRSGNVPDAAGSQRHRTQSRPGILSGLSADELRFAVLSEDTAAISKAPGVGKKTAQKLILELKDKLDLEDAFEKKLSGAAGQNSGKPANTAAEEAVQALTALGYSGTEALQAVRKVEAAPEMDAEEI